MTPVELINKTVEKIIAQNGRSVSMYAGKQNGCHYRDKWGRRCAVGLWMHDIEYYADTASFIGSLAVEENGKRTVDFLLVNEAHGHSVKFWQDLQALHDTADYWQTANGQLSLSDDGKAYLVDLLETYSVE